MIVISHRGYWKNTAEKNTVTAFKRSFDLGFGTETDVRDCAGRLVISHDMPVGGEMDFEDFLHLLAGRPLSLAINIKADGMAQRMKDIFRKHPLQNAFVFDMSVPDLLAYLRAGIPAYTRMSDYERTPSCYDKATGIWLDAFESVWYTNETIEKCIADGKQVCLVSPELHGRPPTELWEMIRTQEMTQQSRLLLCTDIPEDACAYFEINAEFQMNH